MLKFIGCGSAFNTELGNNSAYFKVNDSMYLIDCGSATFGDIIKYNLLNDIKHLYIFITHMHSDHVGSLGDLIFYSYFVKGLRAEVFYPKPKDLKKFLHLMGVADLYHGFIVGKGEIGTILDNQQDKVKFEPIKVNHVKEIDSWGYLITIDGKKIWYSGDTNEVHPTPLWLLKAGELEAFYQDTCGIDYDGNVHLYYERLLNEIPIEFRKKVWCMHLDGKFDYAKATSDWFHVVHREKFK